jgi:PadR family transcriptional regulator PadR
MVLLAVIRPSKESYGVQISREIAEKSGREVALASVYAALERLEKKGLVISARGLPSPERGGKARTYFQPTALGVTEARDAQSTLQKLASGLAAFNSAVMLAGVIALGVGTLTRADPQTPCFMRTGC